MTVFDNVKELKPWVVGAIAFDAAVTSLLVAVFEVDAVKTTIATRFPTQAKTQISTGRYASRTTIVA